MSHRLDYYFRQRVSEAELDLGFSLLEQADHDLAADLGFTGVIANAVVSQHAPVPDLTVDVSGPGVILDQLGQRVFFSAIQNVNVAQDDNGVTTGVAGAGNEKIVSVFVKFDRVLSDPRVDGNSLTVFFRRDESFQFIVVQGAEASSGGAIPPPLRSDAVLLADITRAFGQTQVLSANISVARRQDALVATGSPRSLRRGRTLEVVADLLGFYNAHVNGTADRHLAASVDYAGGVAWADGSTNPATTVEAQLDKLVADLAAASGAPKVGAPATAGSPNSLIAGTVKSQLDALLGFLNGHINSAGTAHPASSISYAGGGAWADSTSNPATTVEAQLDKVIGDLAGAAGADKIGVSISAVWGDGTGISATRVKTALEEILLDLAASQGGYRIGAAATSGSPNSLIQGTVKSQLDVLLGFLNGHINSAGTAHPASALSFAGGGNWADGTTNPATTVEAQLDKLVSDLTGTAGGGANGASKIGVDSGTFWSAGTLRSVLSAIQSGAAWKSAANSFTQTQSINTPSGTARMSLNATGTVRHLLLEIPTQLTVISTLFASWRVYAVGDVAVGGKASLEFTFNAGWDGSQWVKDNTSLGNVARIILASSGAIQIQSTTAGSPFGEFNWTGSQLTSNPETDFGIFGVRSPGQIDHLVVLAGGRPGSGPHETAINFRKQFPAAPSSNTVTVIGTPDGFPASPVFTVDNISNFGLRVAAQATAPGTGTRCSLVANIRST